MKRALGVLTGILFIGAGCSTPVTKNTTNNQINSHSPAEVTTTTTNNAAKNTTLQDVKNFNLHIPANWSVTEKFDSEHGTLTTTLTNKKNPALVILIKSSPIASAFGAGVQYPTTLTETKKYTTNDPKTELTYNLFKACPSCTLTKADKEYFRFSGEELQAAGYVQVDWVRNDTGVQGKITSSLDSAPNKAFTLSEQQEIIDTVKAIASSFTFSDIK